MVRGASQPDSKPSTWTSIAQVLMLLFALIPVVTTWILDVSTGIAIALTVGYLIGATLIVVNLFRTRSDRR